MLNEHLLERDKQRFEALNIPVWQNQYTGKGIKIGILGCEPGAHHNGAWLINQVASDAEIIEYHVYSKPAMTWEEALQKALDDNVDIICCSIEKYSWNNELEELSRQLYEKGVIMITSSGNSYKEIKYWPSSSPYWFVSGAFNGDDGRDPYSNYGDKLTFLMYTNFVNMNSSGSLVPISHTSGTPQVPCGMVALLKEHYGIFGPEEFSQFIPTYAEDLGLDGKDGDTGYGLLKMPEKITEIIKEEDTMFKDFDSVAGYAKEAVAWVEQEGIMQGDNGNFKPTDKLERQELAVILHNLHKQGYLVKVRE